MEEGQQNTISQSTIKAPVHLFSKANLVTSLVSIFVLIVGALLGAYITKYLPEAQTTNTATPTTTQLESFLENQKFSNWSLLVKGRVTSKNQNSFTISPIKETFGSDGSYSVQDSQDTRTLQIDYVPEQTKLVKTTTQSFSLVNKEDITFGQLEVGSIVKGTVKPLKTNSGWQNRALSVTVLQ